MTEALPDWPSLAHAVAYCAVALFLLTAGGNLACRLLFRLPSLRSAPRSAGMEAGTEANAATIAGPDAGGDSGTGQAEARAGRVIGSLERLIVGLGIATQSWQILAAVIALKTVARFKELDDKRFAEYFLVGSLFSLLWAVIVTAGWMAYDQSLGLDLAQMVAMAVGTDPAE